MSTIYDSRYRACIALLKSRRTALNLTQAVIAEKLGVPQAYVSKYETGQRRIDIVELLDICNVLNLSISSLLTEINKAK